MIGVNYSDWVGKKVVKKSKKPFKSGMMVATPTEVVEHHHLPGEPAFKFEEDDSVVECRRCRLCLEYR